MTDFSIDESKRSDFLIKMYETYNKEIARHFGLAWQAVSVFLASIIAIVAAVSKIPGAPPYVIISLYLFLVTWAIEVVIDAAYWYNRNLVVVANIERQFMRDTDAKDIHWYFLEHRRFNKPITFMRSLLFFLVTIALAVLGFYVALPEINGRPGFFCQFSSYVPLIVALILGLVIRHFAIGKNKEYLTFVTNAPGVDRGKLTFAAPEHDLSYDPGSTATGAVMTWIENALLGILGIQITDPAKVRPWPWWALPAILAAALAGGSIAWYICAHLQHAL
jgi:hypothetical protein